MFIQNWYNDLVFSDYQHWICYLHAWCYLFRPLRNVNNRLRIGNLNIHARYPLSVALWSCLWSLAQWDTSDRDNFKVCVIDGQCVVDVSIMCDVELRCCVLPAESNSASHKYKNMSTRRGAQFVHMEKFTQGNANYLLETVSKQDHDLMIKGDLIWDKSRVAVLFTRT